MLNISSRLDGCEFEAAGLRGLVYPAQSAMMAAGTGVLTGPAARPQRKRVMLFRLMPPVILTVVIGLSWPSQAGEQHHHKVIIHKPLVTHGAPSELAGLRWRIRILQEQLNVHTPCGGTLRNDP
jgi:hypothetical protein